MGQVRLLAEEVNLLARVASARRQAAREAIIVDELNLAAGEQLNVSSKTSAGLGVLVLAGFLVREVTIAGRVAADLAGRGDLLCLSYVEPSEEQLLPHAVDWIALAPARLAVLDESFCEQIGQWPEVLCALVERAHRSGERAALDRAIARSSTVEVRLLMCLWHWASLWSTVGADGVRLAVPLSHERLARLIGAARPTVTTAIGRLRDAGYLDQRRDGQWLLMDAPSNGAGASGGGPDGPALDAARLHVPPRLGARERIRREGDRQAVRPPDLYERLAQQRELLRVAAERHATQLAVLRDRSRALQAATRRRGDGETAPAGLDGSRHGGKQQVR
jgi:CRP/FNR family cyclic AMP-dependent transcriptional regulator